MRGLQIHKAADTVDNIACGAYSAADCGFPVVFSGADEHADGCADGEPDADAFDKLIAAHAIHKRTS